MVTNQNNQPKNANQNNASTQNNQNNPDYSDGKDLIGKVFTYGSNIVSRPVGNSLAKLINPKWGVPNLGNPWGALALSGLDFITYKASALNRTIKQAGAVFYGAKAVYDIAGFIKGDYSSLIDLPFDASMAYIAAKDANEAYREKNTSPVKDMKNLYSGLIKRFSKNNKNKK